MENILVIGAYRSGTNYLQQLVNDNLQVGGNNLSFIDGWFCNKHAINKNQMRNYNRDTILLLVYKNPYKWVDSLVRQSYDLCQEYRIHYDKGHTPLNIMYQHPEHDDSTRMQVTVSLEKVCDLYNVFHTFWLDKIKEFRHDIVYHGNLYKDSKSYVDYVSSKFDISRRKEHEEPLVVNGSRPFDRQYYDREQLTENLSEMQRYVIYQCISPKVIDSLKSQEMWPTNPANENTTNT